MGLGDEGRACWWFTLTFGPPLRYKEWRVDKLETKEMLS